MSAQSRLTNLSARAQDPPKLSDQQWGVVGVVGVVLIVMAICQIITFNDFTDVLTSLGLKSSNVWAAVVIVAELWGSAFFFKIRLSRLFRTVSAVAATLAAGFWFIVSIMVVTGASGSSLSNSGYFGRYLAQGPGWWTVLEASVLLLWVLYNFELMSVNLIIRGRK